LKNGTGFEFALCGLTIKTCDAIDDINITLPGENAVMLI
jgi:hypothetical protein